MSEQEFIEENEGALHSIESAIIEAYRSDSSLLDLDVLDILDAAIRRYGLEAQGREASPPRLAARPAAAYELVRRTCEILLGREASGGSDEMEARLAAEEIEVDTLVACLKRVRKSTRYWNDKAGRQGYLDFVSQFV